MKQNGLDRKATKEDGVVENTYIINFDASIFSQIQEFIQHDLDIVGNSLTIIGCDGGFSKCIPKQNWSHLTTEEACKLCKNSQLKKHGATKRIDFPNHYLQQRILPTQVTSFLGTKEKSIDAYREFKYEGIPIFNLAAFDLAIYTRTLSAQELFSSESLELKDRLADVCNLIDWLKESIEFGGSTTLLACNGNYMLNGVCREFAKLNGSRFLSVEMEPLQNSGYLRYKYFESRDSIDSKARRWENFLGYKFKRHNFSNVLKQFENRIMGNAHNSYVVQNEETSTLHKIQELKLHTKSIRSVFLSSSEELLAHSIAFDTDFSFEHYANYQINFLEYIIEEARKFPDIGIIIRSHPRQGISKKSHVISEEFTKIEMLLKLNQIPENVLFIEPSDLISSYRVLAQSDVVNFFWSTIGLESILLGIPTTTLSPEIKIWPLKELTNHQFETSELAWANFFSVEVSVGIPIDSKVIEWFERTFKGNWYQTCIPILTSSTLLNPKNLFWRVIDRFALRSWIIKRWIQFFPTKKALNENYGVRHQWTIFEASSRRISYLELRRWREYWLNELKGIKPDIG